MSKKRILVIVLVLILISCKDNQTVHPGIFQISKEFIYPGSPDFVYDHLTGDISLWWDHSFSEKPFKLYIEAKPGGGFYELFDENGNGVRHAIITAADRGKLLRFEGPLGLAGKSILMVTTYTLSPKGTDSTLLKLNIHASGEVDNKLQDVVGRVWDHFLGDQFTPYISQKVKEITKK
ncbi:MAG: hypothetical protein Kow00108_14670 [Calditrichia bacterium]